MLTEVKRQEGNSYILRNATATRMAIDNGMQDINVEAPMYSFSRAVNMYLQDYKNYGPEYCISIGCKHTMNKYFNDIVRRRLYGEDVPTLVKGDLMMVTQNWSRNGHILYNGDHVIVEEIFAHKIGIVAGLHFMPIKLKAKKLNGEEFFVEDSLLAESIEYPTG